MAADAQTPLGDEASAEQVREALAWDQSVLDALTPKMQTALELRQNGQHDRAEKLFREILRSEPRLAEPRLELAHLAAGREDWGEAQDQARIAVTTLIAGGQWTMDVDPAPLLSFAMNLLGETLVRAIEGGDLFLRDKDKFESVWNEASVLFTEAKKLDPTNEDARRNAVRYRPL
ncbi:MAG: hypothetical protein GY898_02965 [Proteobacteria bacterium]|nr:hypothetical protein [Pseudomonadota bacterium]